MSGNEWKLAMVSENPDNLQSSQSEVTLPQPPRFVAHEELTERGTAQRLFRRSIDPPVQGRLSREEELVLFKRLNYCGYRMSRMWDRFDRLTKAEQDRYLKWYHQYTRIRERIIDANMGLVFDLLSRNRFKNVSFDELRSEGLMALLRASDTYNPWSGFRFSTYACNSILRSFSRVAVMESKRRHLWASSFEPSMAPADLFEEKHSDRMGLLGERLSAIINDKDAGLSDNERFVLSQRFPFQPNKRKATLVTVGEAMKISKERVRQIQESALNKLRQLLSLDPILR